MNYSIHLFHLIKNLLVFISNKTISNRNANVRQFSIIIMYHMISLIFGGYSFSNNQKHDNPLMFIIGNSKCNKLRGLTFDKKNFL